MDKIKAIVQVGKLGKLEEASVNPSETEIEVVPQHAYGLSKVTVDAIKLQDKSVNPSEVPQNITADEGYNGLSAVNVTAAKLQAKVVEPAEEAQVITADGDNYGLELVTVKGIKLQSKTAEATTSEQIISADSGFTGLNKVTIAPIKLQNKNIKADAKAQLVTADSGYTALSSVNVDALKLQDKIAEASNEDITINADSGYDALKSVTINAVKYDKYSSYEDYVKFFKANSGTYKFQTASEDVTIPSIKIDDSNARALSLPTWENKTSAGYESALSISGNSALTSALINVKKLRAKIYATISSDNTEALLEELVFTRTDYVSFRNGFNYFLKMKIIVVENENVTLNDASGLLNSSSPHFQAGGDGAIYVPDSAVSWYKKATNWSTLAEYIKPMSEYKGWTLEDD